MPDTDDTTVTATAHRILGQARTFAVVGASAKPHRPSYEVIGTLMDHGYAVIPVNPNYSRVRGLDCYPDLASIPEHVRVDVVDLFRRSEEVGQHVEEAVERGVDAVWMQLGVIDHEAARRAREAGLDVVMDRCPAIELRRRDRADTRGRD